MFSFHPLLTDAPFCRPGQHRVYGVARHEEARISCDLDANPSVSLHFRWLFNSSAGVIELPTSTLATCPALILISVVYSAPLITASASRLCHVFTTLFQPVSPPIHTCLPYLRVS
jgi:hypothetical protein